MAAVEAADHQPEARFVSGLELYQQLKPAHVKLQELYEQLLSDRLSFLAYPDSSHAARHALACQTYVRSLLCLTRPAQGRLAALLGQACAADLSRDLMMDLFLHVIHFNKTEPAAGAQPKSAIEAHFLKNMASHFQDYLNAALGEDLQEYYMDDYSSRIVMSCASNYHAKVENSLKSIEKSFEDAKKNKVGELIAYDGKMISKKIQLPEVGVLVCEMETTSEASDLVSYLQSFLPVYDGAYPNTVTDYIKQYGAEIIVALDKLENQVLSVEVSSVMLSIYLEIQSFIAATNDLDIPSMNRKDSCLSPRFSLELKDIVSILTADGHRKLSVGQCHSCSALRDMNSISAYQDYAKNESSFKLLDESKLKDAGLSQNLHFYLESLCMKMIISLTETAVMTALERRSSTADNQGLKIISKTLGDLVERLSSKDSSKYEECKKGCDKFYCSLAKYFFLPVCVHLNELRQGDFGKLFFRKMEHLLRKLCLLPMYSEVTASETVPYIGLTEKLAVCTFSVLNHFSSTNNQSQYIMWFFEAKLPVLMDSVFLHVSEEVTGTLAPLLRSIITNVKRIRATIDTNGNEDSSEKSHHHVGDELSPLFVDIYHPRICKVSAFACMLLSLYSCFDSEASALTCLEELSEAGLCCCMTSNTILDKLLTNIGEKKTVIIERTLDLIKLTVMQSLNGISLLKKENCFQCNLIEIRKSVYIEQDMEGFVLLQLKTEDDAKLVKFQASNQIVRKLASVDSLSYVDLKWAGLMNYKTAVGSSLNMSLHNHLLYLVWFCPQNIRSFLFEHVYRDFIERTLKTSFCTQNSLNLPENVSALTASFTAVSSCLLTDKSARLALTDSQWQAWSHFFIGSSRTKSLLLARACYAFGCIVLCFELPDLRMPVSGDASERHPASFFNVEDKMVEAQQTFFKCVNSDVKDEAALHDALDSMLITWSVLDELNGVPLFNNYIEQRMLLDENGSLVPLKLVIAVLRVLADPNHWVRSLLLNLRLHDTCALIKSWLSVAVGLRPRSEERNLMLSRLRECLIRPELMALHTALLAPVFTALIDVNYSTILEVKGGVVETVCGRTADHNTVTGGNLVTDVSSVAHTTSPCSAAEIFDPVPILLKSMSLIDDRGPQTQRKQLFPELVPLVLHCLIEHHKAFLARQDSAEPEVATPDVQVLPDTVDDGILAKALGSWWSQSATPIVEPQPSTKKAESKGKTRAFPAPHGRGLERVLEKILFLCEENGAVEQAMISANCLGVTLDGFSRIMKDSVSYQGAATYALRLWTRLAQTRVTAGELKQFLSLFMGRNPPVDELLVALSKLLETTLEVPQYELIFSVVNDTRSEPQCPLHGWNIFDMLGNSKPVEQSPAANQIPPHGLLSKAISLDEVEKSLLELRINSVDTGCVYSGLVRSRIACVMSSNCTDWLPLKDSTTAIFWIKLNPAKRPDGVLDLDRMTYTDEEKAVNIHLFSFGVKKFTVSAFINAMTGFCSIELVSNSSPDEPCAPILDCMLDWSELLDGAWHFVTFSWPGHNTKKPASVVLEYSIDGELKKTDFKLKPLGSMKPDSPFVLLGHRDHLSSASDAPPVPPCIDSYALTSFTLFACPRLDKMTILLLMAHGKEATNFLPLEQEETCSLIKRYITPKFVESLQQSYPPTPDKTLAEMFGRFVLNAFNSLIPSLLFHYNSSDSENFLSYSPSNVSTQESRCAYNTAVRRPCLMFDFPVLPRRVQLLHHALLQLGGASTLLHVLVRVVELNTLGFDGPRSLINEDLSSARYGERGSSPDFSELLQWAEISVLHTQMLDSSSPSNTNCGATKSQNWCQAKALKLLLWAVKESPQICRQFHAMNGTELVMRLLYSPNMDTRLEVLKAVLEECISEPIICLDRSHDLLGHVVGLLNQPSPRALLTDAPLFAQLLTHWHYVELRKLELRETASPSPKNRLPNKLALDGCYGSCHSLDVLHRLVSFISQAPVNAFSAFNVWQLHRVDALHLILTMTQVLLVLDWPEMQVSPRVLQATVQCFVPPRDSDSPLPSWRVSTVREIVNYLVLRVEPCRALVWHSASCTARLLQIYSSSSKLAEPSKTQKLIREIIETELAEEVTEELTRVFPVLDVSVVAQEGKGLLTKEDADRISISSSSFDTSSGHSIPASPPQENVLELKVQVETPFSDPGEKVVTDSNDPVISATELGSNADTKRLSFEGAAGTTEPTCGPTEPLPSSGKGSGFTQFSGSPQSLINSGRSTPLIWPPATQPNKKLDAIDACLINALHGFLRSLDSRKLTDIVTECIKPSHLALLANHGSVDVRTSVMKIFRNIICRKSIALRNMSVFKEHLMIVHHQLACRGSSDELLMSCYYLVVSKPGHGVEASDYALITENLRTELRSPAIQDHVLETSAPLLAVLPKVDGLKFEVVDKVLVFLSTLIEVGTCNRGKLLTMENLGESLILTLQSTSKEATFRSTLVSHPIIDLCRSLLLLGDDMAAKGLDLITKLFLLCSSSAGRMRGAAINVLEGTIINAVVCLLRAMMSVSNKVIAKSLSGLKLGRKRERTVVVEEAEHRSLSIFADLQTQYELLIIPLSEQLAATIDSVLPNQTSFVLRTIRILKMASNFILKLDWLSTDTGSGSALPLFLLDLQCKLLVSWDDLVAHSGRLGFVSTRTMESHQFEVLGREYELEMRSTLPELLCLLSSPTASLAHFTELLRRLARDVKTLRTVLIYTRDRSCQLFDVLGFNLVQKSKSLQVGSQAACDCGKVMAAYEAIGRCSLNRSDATNTANPEALLNEHLQRRLYLADLAVSMDVKDCISSAVRDHEAHARIISDVYNKFLVIHAGLKKRVLDEISHSENIYRDMTKQWLQLSNDAFSDQSPWGGTTPSWWELLDYENDNRTRGLLGRTLLKVHPKFMMEERRGNEDVLKLSSETDYVPEQHQPLYTVLKDSDSDLLHGDRMNLFSCDHHNGLNIKLTCKGWIIKPGIDWRGTIFIADGIYFQGVKTVCSYGKKLDVKVESSLFIPSEDISDVRRMRYHLKEVAFELQLSDRKSWLFVCNTERDREKILEELHQINKIEFPLHLKDPLGDATKAWQSRKMSNFDYLMTLNSLAGRTYNDLNQYPIFPYVLADYTSDTLDLSNVSSYRDLSKPMPVQTPEREELFRQRYENSAEISVDGFQHHYSSLYSNCVVVPNYLVRLPPFTLFFLHFQGGKFDEPARTFQDLEQTYNKITRDTLVDFKEAIPEMYYLPEMFYNGERLDLKARSDGSVVDHVLLPKWCRGDRRTFVLCHRAALESPHVTANLPSWIDLVFGFKQTGLRAKEAINLYHPQGYPENQGSVSNERAWQEAISMYGEVPRQLFPTAPHPKILPDPHAKQLYMQLSHNTRLIECPVKGLKLESFAFFNDIDHLYLASPDHDSETLDEHTAPLNTGDFSDVFYAAPKGALVMIDPSGGTHVLQASASDGVARVWSPGHACAYPVFSLPPYAKMTCCAYEDGQVWVGTSCGLLLLFNLSFSAPERRPLTTPKSSKKPLRRVDELVYSVLCSSSYELLGGQSSVLTLTLCPRYNVAVTGDSSGNCFVWDVRQPRLLRTVAAFNTAVACSAVSKTTGDWVVASRAVRNEGSPAHSDVSCKLRLFSMNGGAAADVVCPAPVMKLAYSCLVEGRSVNVIAAVTTDPTCNVILYSSWDLTSLVTVTARTNSLVRSLVWSTDCSQLLVHYSCGGYQVFQSKLSELRKHKLASVKIIEVTPDCARAFTNYVIDE
ncbi:uncharacterized protein LOC108678159 isoform X2 [Hyalella azteca]|uniref:Uncharacterized protein LOC108678159 isoform X2 n=1 Tax=Hyalella azteca TaxID=294128 RepID=A0A8B7P757_HYAAZ|nr:uncharacterized protein LOC108678159 isoform X2 [Hyalella azteca]